MRVIEVRSCRECDYHHVAQHGETPVCLHDESYYMACVIRKGEKFPRFCPLRGAKDG